MMRARSFERAGPSGEDTSRYPGSYYAAASTREAIAAPPVTDRIDTEFCVVGGGYSGLGAGLALARLGRSVHLVEAGPIGWGASGRNGGQVHVGWNRDQKWFERRLGEPAARQMWDIALSARGFLDHLMAQDADHCDFRPGLIHADHRARYVPHTHAHVRYMRDHYGYDSLHALDRDELSAMVASPGFFGGSLDKLGGHLHPLKLAQTMARLATGSGAVLHAHSPATAVARAGAGWRVTTPAGTITAARVLIATGGYATGLVPAIDAHVLPNNAYIATTAPLSPDLARSLIPGGQAVSDSRFVVTYFRVTPDHRLLFGGGETYGYRFPTDIGAFVRPHLERVYPQLAGIELAQAWGGTLAMTMHRLPYAAQVQPGLFTLSGYSGLGVVLAPWLGTVVGEAMAGQDSGAMEWLQRLPGPRFPGGPILRLPTQAAAMTFYALRDRF